MQVLIKQAKIIDPKSPHHNKVRDILIEKGVIEDIKSSISATSAKTLESSDLHASPGWVDGFGFYGEPGYENKETIATGLEAAAQGGYTDVAAIPNTSPPTSHASQIDFLRAASARHITNLHPLGSISLDIKGQHLAEMLEMLDAGAVAFTDGLQPVQDAGLMLRALEYSSSRDYTLLNLPIVDSLQRHGEMHESEYSVKYGMAGISPMAETLMVHRDIELARYHDARLHIPAISTAESLKMIKEAKKQGVKISCGVNPAHLVYTDADLAEYDTQLKTLLPLRSEKDRKALVMGLNKGDIDCISSMHLPQNPEEKDTDYKNAAPGMTMIQTTLPLLIKAGIQVERYADILSHSIRKVLNLSPVSIEKGQKACLSVWDPSVTWLYDLSSNASFASNSPLLGQTLQGKVKAIINQNKIKQI